MIKQSKKYSKNCFWFSTIVSKKDNLPYIYKTIEEIKPVEFDTIEMQHGQKISRIVIWTFLSKEEQKLFTKAILSNKLNDASLFKEEAFLKTPCSA